MQTAIYTLTSDLHDKTSVDALTHNFLDSLGIDYQLHIADFVGNSALEIEMTAQG